MKFLKDAILTFLFIGFLNFSDLPESSVRVTNSKQYEPDFERKRDTAYVVNFWATWNGTTHDESSPFRVMLVSRELPHPVSSRLLPLITTSQIQPDAVLPDSSDRWINHLDPGWSGEVPFAVIHEHSPRITWNTTFFDALIGHKLNSES